MATNAADMVENNRVDEQNGNRIGKHGWIDSTLIATVAVSWPMRYVLVGAMILACNTLPFLLGSRGTYLYLLIDMLALALVLTLWCTHPINLHAVRGWFGWAALCAIIYASVALVTGDGGGKRLALAVAFLSVCPLLFLLLNQIGGLEKYLTAFVNAMSALAVLSLALWLIGPVFNFVEPNCSIDNSWNGQGVNIPSAGYYYLQYMTQSVNIMNSVIVRNTGLFAEAPMYSYVLSMALVVECFLLRKPRAVVALVLSVCIVSTFSTTGIILVMGVLLLKFVASITHMHPRFRRVVLVISIIAAVAVVIIAVWLFNAKMRTNSGNVRMDDFRAGFLAWQMKPIFGYGLGDSVSVTQFMSDFRSGNLGFSNSIFDVLTRGGIVFMLPFLIAAIGLFMNPTKYTPAAVCFLFLWVITIVTFLPVTMAAFGLGVSKLISLSNCRSRTGCPPLRQDVLV